MTGKNLEFWKRWITRCNMNWVVTNRSRDLNFHRSCFCGTRQTWLAFTDGSCTTILTTVLKRRVSQIFPKPAFHRKKTTVIVWWDLSVTRRTLHRQRQTTSTWPHWEILKKPVKELILVEFEGDSNQKNTKYGFYR